MLHRQFLAAASAVPAVVLVGLAEEQVVALVAVVEEQVVAFAAVATTPVVASPAAAIAGTWPIVHVGSARVEVEARGGPCGASHDAPRACLGWQIYLSYTSWSSDPWISIWSARRTLKRNLRGYVFDGSWI